MVIQSVGNSRRGTSLVEILVVMVVLLIGIMTIIQMFPSGFRVVRAAESQTIATRLVQQELERWKNMAANLPTGILAIDDDGNVLNDQYPGPPFGTFQKNGNGEWVKVNGAYARWNVLNLRQVVGETTSIPVATYFQTGGGKQYGSRYTLAFSPIEQNGLAIKSGDLRRRVGDSESYPPFLQPGHYAIDYSISKGRSGKPVFHVAFPRDVGAAPRSYYITYSFWATADAGQEPQLFSKLNQLIPDVPGDLAGWVQVPIDVPEGYEVTEIDAYSDSCARGFVLRQGDTWSDSPYEYYVADPYLGVIAFNPVGHGMYEYTASGIRPIEARVDYRIYDPRIIREDRVVPHPKNADPNSPISIKLSLRFILNAGKPNDIGDGDATDNPDEPTFEGLVRQRIGVRVTNASQLLVPDSVMIVDLATGLRVDTTNVEIDFPAGVVVLPQKANLVDFTGKPPDDSAKDVPLAGRHVRFFYRADGDWTIQCQKAYTVYQRDWTGGNAIYNFYHKMADDSAYPNRLLFAQCEAEKTVAVDYSYVKDGTEYKNVGEIHQISAATFDPGNGKDFCYADLKVPKGGVIKRIFAVVGISMRVRAIWRDGGSWRHVDADTTLLRDTRL